VALVLPFAVPSMAQAADPPIPSTSVCSIGTSKDYACMEVNAKKVPSGDTATFTGTLSTKAQKNLKKLDQWRQHRVLVSLPDQARSGWFTVKDRP